MTANAVIAGTATTNGGKHKDDLVGGSGSEVLLEHQLHAVR
jgi:hypothetical protein